MKRKRQINKYSQNVSDNEAENSVENGNDDLEDDYTSSRNEAIAKRNEFLRLSGLLSIKESLINEVSKNAVPKKIKNENANNSEVLPKRQSLRLQNKSAEVTPDSKELSETVPINDYDRRRKPAGPIKMTPEGDDNSEDVCNEYLLNLKPHLSIEGDADIPQLEGDKLDSFKKRVQELNLKVMRKVCPKRITSLAIHPSETKLLVAGGATDGFVGLWDVHAEDKYVQTYQPHSSNVGCITFSPYHHQRLFSTSLDGTVRCADLNKEVFEQIYASDELMYRYHTTWHEEVDANTLLVAHGTGEVGIIDMRLDGGSSSITMYKCHERSIRTIHKHPLDNNYFVTASGIGEVKVWDIRASKKKGKEVCEMKHAKSVTSAFFSPAGNYLLTTCSDDRLRVYDTSNIFSGIPKVVMNISHNNHTGRWLTTFKACWYPSREDAFIVGSLGHPRSVEIYGIHGKIIHKLQHEELNVVLSTVKFHPSQMAVVGGNSSGKMFAFL